MEYQDHDAGLNIKTSIITAVVVTATQAGMFGRATVNGAGSFDFVVDVDDLGEPGAGIDRFKIQLSNGYAAGVSKRPQIVAQLRLDITLDEVKLL